MLPELPNGWVYVDIAYKGIYAGSRKNGGSFSVSGPIYVPVPIRANVQKEAASKYDRSFDTPDGEVTVKGTEAVFAGFYKQAWESLRSAACDAADEGIEVTADYIQNTLVPEMEPLSGKRGGFKKVVADENKVDNLEGQALKDYLKSIGVKFN